MLSFKARGILFSIVSASIFGLMPLFAKYIYADGCTASGLVFIRMFFGSIVLFFLAKKYGTNPLNINSRQFRQIFILSAGFAPTPVLLYAAYNYISTGAAATIHFVYPAFAFLICWLFYKDKIDMWQLTSLVLCTVGVVLFYRPGNDGNLFGVAIAFLSGITYAFYAVYMGKSELKHTEKFWMNFHMNWVSMIIVLAGSVPAGIFALPQSVMGWAVGFVFAMLMTVIACVLFQLGVNYIGPQQATIFSTFEPLTSVVVGVLFLSEELDARSMAGIVIILIAVLLLIVTDGRKKREQLKKMDVVSS